MCTSLVSGPSFCRCETDVTLQKAYTMLASDSLKQVSDSAVLNGGNSPSCCKCCRDVRIVKNKIKKTTVHIVTQTDL